MLGENVQEVISVRIGARRFFVTGHYVLLFEDGTFECNCQLGTRWLPNSDIHQRRCSHIQDTYLYWLNGENKKRKMMEEVKQHAAEVERHIAVVKETKPVEPQKGFIAKPKRIINLEDE